MKVKIYEGGVIFSKKQKNLKRVIIITPLDENYFFEKNNETEFSRKANNRNI